MSDRYFSTSVYRKGATPSDAPLLFIEHEAALEDRKIKRVRRVVLEPQMPEHPAAHGTPALIDFLTEPDVEPAVFPFSRIPKNFDDEDLRSTSSVVFVEDPEIRPDGSLEISGEFIINTLWRCPLSALGGGFALRLRLKLDGTALLLDVGQVNKGASCVGTRDRAGWDLLSFQEIDDTTVDAVKFEPLGNWLDRPLLASVVSAAPANWSPDDVPVLRALLQDEPPQTASWINQHLGGHPRFAAGLVLRSAARSEGAMRLPGGGGLAAMIWIDKADGQPGTTRTPLRPELLGLSPAHPFWIVYPEDGHGALFLGGEDRGALDGAGRTPRRDNWQFSFRIDEHPTETLYKFGASVERLWRDAVSRPVIMGLRGLDSDRSVSLLPADLPYRDPGVLRANWFDKTRTLPHSDTPISTDDFLKGWWTRFAVRVGDQAAPEFLGPPSLCPPPTTSEPWQNGNLMGHAQRRDLTFPELRLADGTAATRRIDVAPIDIDPLAPVRLAPLGAESGTEALAAPAEETALLDLALRPAELAGAELLPDALRPLDNSILLGSMLFDLADQDTMISPPAPILLGRAGRLSVVLRSSDGQAAISAVPFFAIDLSFGLRRVVPATQDLGRTRDDDAKGIWAAPLVVPLSDTFSAGKTALSFAERTRAERGRDRVSHQVLVELRLLEGVGVDDDEDALIDAVVLDPTPFLAGRVLSRLSTPEGSALAVLEIGSGTTEVWRLDSRDSDEVALLLPPQVTGEEMIKGKLTRPPDGTPIPDPDNLPFDFKNAPATRLLIDRSIQPRARTLAPWNLRAMLGFVESDAPGAGLVAVESELLYGLGYVWTPEGTRLAELEAWGGRLVDTDIPDLTSGDQGDVKATGYREHYSKWRTSLQTRAAQLVPYKQLRATDETSGERRLESFTDGVRHRFRPTRRTADPFQLDNYARDRRRASGQTPGLTDSDTLPLAGGVDLLFEAETIYDEVLRSPDSVDGRLGNLAFGALGGDGAQEARFANGKTLIASVTESGFTRSIRLERIGRIAMLWNVAKHVIVYERTVKTPRRYEGDQPPDFEGIAAMRKVREYVEILEPTRRYPDFGEADRETGPLRGSRFVSTKIDVRSDWGYATENGWAMPLAGPVPAGLEQFYPIPEILLNLARARGRGGGEVAQLCTSPERLVFYTSTREEDGTQTDLWPSVRDVDFPVLPLPSAPSMSHPSFPVDGLAADPDGMLPDPERMEPGMDRFSVSLKRSEDPVNLTLGRAGDGLEARLESICLARANPLSASQSQPAQDAQRLTDGDRALRDALDRLGAHVARARDGLPVNTQHARRDADRAKTILETYNGTLDAVQAGPSPWDSFWDSQKTRQDAWIRRVEKVADDLIRDLRKELTSLVVNPGDEEKIKLRLRGYVEGIFQQLAAELQGMDIVLEEVLREVRGSADAIVADLSTRLETSGMRVLSRLERISLDGDEVSAADLARLREDLSPVIVAARTQLRTSLRTLPNRLFGPLSGVFNKAGGLDISAADNLVALIDTILDEIAEALQTANEDDPDGLPAPVMLERIRVAGEALRFDVTDEIAATLSDLADKLLAQTANGTSLRDLLRELFGKKASLAVDLEKRRADILGLLDDLGNIGGLLNDLEAAFRDLIDPATGELKELFDGVANLGTEAKEALKDLTSGLDDAKDELTATANQLKDKIDQALNGPAAEFLGRLRGLDGDVARVEGAWRPVSDLARETFRGDLLKGSPVDIASRSLRLVQAWGDAPVAEALDMTRDRLAYYLDPAKELIDSTPAGALLRRFGDDAANALGLRQPFERLGERFVPDFGDSFDFGKMLPDFAGLKLTDLMPDVLVPGRVPDWVRIRHGFDEKAVLGWATADIDLRLDGRPELFAIGPVAVVLRDPRFAGSTRIEADAAGTRTTTNAGLATDLEMIVGPEALVTYRNAELRLSENGDLKFDFDPSRLELASAMQFISDLMESFVGGDSGFSFAVLPEGGLSTRFDLPLPNLTGGAFSLTNLSLHTRLDLLFLRRFEIRAGFWLSRPERPFNLSILFLGGGGWVGVTTAYAPGHALSVRVTIGIAVGATAALNLGVASGSVQMLAQLSATFVSDASGNRSGPAITIGLLTFGELSILGLVSAYIGLGYSVTYDGGDGSLTGTGWLAVRIKICWCVEVNVSKAVTVRLAGSGGRQSQQTPLMASQSAPDYGAMAEREMANLAF